MNRMIVFVTALMVVSSGVRAKSRPEVKGQMQQMFTSLLNLQPFLVSAEKFQNPKNSEIIRKDLNRLAQFKHIFPKKMAEEEPGIVAISQLFHETVVDAKKRFKRGSYDYSRQRLRTATAYCFSCHSRVNSEQSFQDLEKRVESSQLSSYEKADVFAATRQFEKALKAYTQILSERPKNHLGLIEYTRSLRRALSISVRVKQSPQETLQLLNGVLARKDLPQFIHQYAEHWKKDAESWASEKPEKKKPSSEELIQKGRKMIERAEKLQAFPADENGEISFLRASNYLHEALDESPKSQSRAEALYLLGVSYASVQDPALWDLDRIYFETCVREAPHTELSKKCFHRFSEKVYMGYTGSSGTFIPEDEQKRIEELRKLSETQAS